MHFLSRRIELFAEIDQILYINLCESNVIPLRLDTSRWFRYSLLATQP